MISHQSRSRALPFAFPLAFPIALLLALTGIGCQRAGEKVAGNGSEVENAISGKVFRPDAVPVAGAVVTLVPSEYNPFTDTNLVLEKDTTDSQGRFSFAAPESGAYNLEANSANLGMNALVPGRQPDTLILSKPGTISLEKSGLLAPDLYIPGSQIRCTVDSGRVLWQAIPTGTFDVLYHGAPGALAAGLPVAADHDTRLPAEILVANRDAYLESSEPAQNTGARKYLRLKSGDQGIILLGFDLASAPATDTATLWLAVSEFQLDFENYAYSASVYGFVSPWVEGTAYTLQDPDDGSSYTESEPGIPWDPGFPATSLDPDSRIDVSFEGVRGGQKRHPFPISRRILEGLKSGAYTGIALIENSNRYNNVDFSSSEGSAPPELHLYPAAAIPAKRK